MRVARQCALDKANLCILHFWFIYLNLNFLVLVKKKLVYTVIKPFDYYEEVTDPFNVVIS